jgi:hypothetical protein
MTLSSRSSVTMFFLTFLLNVALVHGSGASHPHSPTTSVATLNRVLSDSGSHIFARQSTGCVQGCQQNLVCNCAANQRCELQAQTCTTCTKMICHDMPGKPEKNVSPGAIAGSVLGGFVVVSIAGIFAYRAWAKKRRTAAQRAGEKGNDLGAFKSARVRSPEDLLMMLVRRKSKVNRLRRLRLTPSPLLLLPFAPKLRISFRSLISPESRQTGRARLHLVNMFRQFPQSPIQTRPKILSSLVLRMAIFSLPPKTFFDRPCIQLTPGRQSRLPSTVATQLSNNQTSFALAKLR